MSRIKKNGKINYTKYITRIIQNNGHKLILINGDYDHIHVLLGMRPTQSISDLMQDIKGSSSKWINLSKFVTGKFSWQEGYGAFSYAKTELKNVIKYIENQKEHHKKQSFYDEYKKRLIDFGIEYDEKYIFNRI